MEGGDKRGGGTGYCTNLEMAARKLERVLMGEEMKRRPEISGKLCSKTSWKRIRLWRNPVKKRYSMNAQGPATQQARLTFQKNPRRGKRAGKRWR